jgi:hypothetical protein
MNILAELRRRQVFKVAVAYGIVAWLLAQVASVTFGPLLLPAWALTFVIALLILLFPVAIFLGWAFEISPEGVRRTRSVETGEPMAARSSVVGYLVTAVVAGGVGASAFWMLSRDSAGDWFERRAQPAIEAAIDAGDWETAFALATEAEARVGDDPDLADIWLRMSRRTTIRSDPPGARVLRRGYTALDAAWEEIGVTPLENVRIPLDLSVLRFELDGYAPVERAIGAGLTLTELPALDTPIDALPGVGQAFIGVGVVTLDPPASLPEGKVRVPGWTEEIDGRRVAFADFFLDRTEVTNAQYKAFVDAGGYRQPSYWDPAVRDAETLTFEQAIALFVDSTGRPGPAAWIAGDFPEGQGDYPVGGVSWYEAAAYARFMRQGLPTARHWRRATAVVTFPWELPLSNLEGEGPRAVGEGGAMSYAGAYDLAGNVREWTATASEAQRLILGGSWNDAGYLVGLDAAASPLDRSRSNGFRLAVTRDAPAVAEMARTPAASLGAAPLFETQPVGDDVFAAYARMFDFAPRPLNASIDETEETRLWTRERIMLDAAYGGERVPLYLYLPSAGAPPYQTIVFWPGLTATTVTSIDDQPMLLDFLLKNGRAVAFPVLPDALERGDGVLGPWAFDAIPFRDNTLKSVTDVLRALDYLQSRSDIDPESFGYFGYSWGGIAGPIVLAREPRIKAAVFLVPSLDGRMDPSVDPVNWLPRVRTPLLEMSGEFDGAVPLDNARRFYELIGTPEPDKRHVIAPGGHFVPREVLIRETLDWFDAYLGPPRSVVASAGGDTP